MKSLKGLLGKRKIKPLKTLSDKDVFFIFKKVIKEELGNLGLEKLQPDYYAHGTIFIKAANSAWSGELFSNRTKIIRQINNELGEKIIREIKLK